VLATLIVLQPGHFTTKFSTQSLSNSPQDGICGSAHNNTLFTPVTLQTAGLCKAGQQSRLILQEYTQPFSASWDCIGDVGMKSASCKASLIVWKEPAQVKKPEQKKSDPMLDAWKKMFGM
jgi:hypothetical protein